MDRRSFLRDASRGAALVSPINSAFSVTPPIDKTSTQAVRDLTQQRSLSSDSERSLSSTLDPWQPSAGQWDIPAIHHLFRRAGFSATLAEINNAKTKTVGVVVDSLLDDGVLAESKMPGVPVYGENWLLVHPYLGTDSVKMQDQQGLYDIWTMDIRRWWSLTMAAGPSDSYYAPLRERMVLFWMNHFVVASQKVYYPQAMYAYNNYLRHNPWGNFKQIVKDITISPAMLIYLDGTLSLRNAPNENYGRELLELFTMGPTYKDGTANYTEDDIKAVARALTGYYVDPANPGPNVVASKYDPARHNSDLIDPPPFGARPGNYGLTSSGDPTVTDIIDLIFNKRGDAIANFICTKLYQHFVYHEVGSVEQAAIDQMSATFKNSNWELKPVLSQLLKSAHFFDPVTIGTGIKSPYDHAIGIFRMFGIKLDVLKTGTLYYYAADQGQVLLDPPNVKGWPGFHSWLNTTSLPLRNSAIATPFTYSGITTVNSSKDGHDHLLTPIVLSDTELTTWAKQFADYDGSLSLFIIQMATFLCAARPSYTALQFVTQGFSYDWAALQGRDVEKLPAIRAIASRIMLLADFQLM